MTNAIEQTPVKVSFLRKITPFDKDGKAGKILFVWGDGITTELRIDDISEQNKIRAQYHGLSQRLGDAVAGCSKDSAYAYAREQQLEIIKVLATENWAKPSTAGMAKTESELAISDLVEAVAKIKGKKVESIDPVVRTATREQRDIWRKNPTVAAEIAAHIAKRAKEMAKESEEFDFPG